MASISDKSLDEFIEISEKEGHRYENREEARAAAQNLVSLVDLLYDMFKDEQSRKNKLKDHPNGFAFPGEGRGCPLCMRHTNDDMWYDKWGQKCMDCHEAHKKKIIPGYVFTDKDNEKHITIDRISWKFDIPTQTLNKLIREDRIKVRTVKGNGTQVVLKRENPNLADVLAKEKVELVKRRQKKST